jgi:hypothetical protein
MKVGTNLFVAFIFLAFISCSKSEEDSMGPDPVETITTTNDVVDRITKEVVGISTLVRSKGQISVTFETTNLIPGHIYNLIWVIYNNPEECLEDPCTFGDLYYNLATLPVAYIATGQVAASSSVTFKAVLEEGDITKQTIRADMTSFGLRDAYKAEIQFGLRSHGPPIPSQQQLQLTTYSGGCTVNFSVSGNNLEVPDEEGECAVIQESIHKAPE